MMALARCERMICALYRCSYCDADVPYAGCAFPPGPSGALPPRSASESGRSGGGGRSSIR